jgi:hypothetical protein
MHRRRADGWGATASPDRKQPGWRSDHPGRSSREELPGRSTLAAKHSARERLRLIDHQRRNATACHLAGMDLARYYGRRPLLDVSLSRLLAVGRWAA